MNNNDITFFGYTNFRNQRKKFGIKRDDRRRHFYAIGKTGMGKSVLLENMAIQDIQRGDGVGFIDPHGEAAENILNYIPEERVNDVIYFNPADLERAIGFNVMEKVETEHRHLVASGLMGVFKKIWPDVWSPRMEYILNNTILALLDYPNSTLLGINRMMSDAEFRSRVVEKITDPVVKSFWTREFASWSQQYATEAVAAIQNKVGQFTSVSLVRNIIGQVNSTIDMRDIMDNQKILIVNLSKGKIGEDNSMLLGALIITKLQLAAMERVNIPEEERKDFFLYIDEFQNFATRSFIGILSEARKYRLALILGHQYIGQLDEYDKMGHHMRDAIFGNIGTIVTFRVGAEDAEFLEKELSPTLTIEDIINLPKYNIYTKLMIDGISGRPFSAETIPPPPKTDKEISKKIIQVSGERYGNSREKVEEKLSRWLGEFKEATDAKNFSQGQNAPGQEVYDAQCSSCGKKTKVPFMPDGTRPTYCKTCRKSQKRKKEEKESSGKREFGEKEVKKTEEEDSLQKDVSLREALEEAKGDAPKKEASSLKEALKDAFEKKKEN
jgi:CxxC-x17-CxxC domain-containing protein